MKKKHHQVHCPYLFLIPWKACIIQVAFEDWFISCIVPQVKTYCLENRIPFKILQSSTSPLDNLHPDVKVVHPPPTAYRPGIYWGIQGLLFSCNVCQYHIYNEELETITVWLLERLQYPPLHYTCYSSLEGCHCKMHTRYLGKLFKTFCGPCK